MTLLYQPIKCYNSTNSEIKAANSIIQGDPKKRAPALIRPRFLVFGPNEMKLWS